MTQFSRLKSWDEITAYAADLRVDRDEKSWELGDLALFACPRNPDGGRPRKGATEEYTVSALALSIGEDRSVVSQWMANAEFWDAAERANLPPNVSWRQCSEARRRSGWRPGAPITDKQRSFAWECVFHYADEAPDHGQNGSRAEILPVIVDGQGQRQVLLVGPRWQGVARVKVREA